MTVAARPLAVRPRRVVALVVAAAGCLVTADWFTSNAVNALRRTSSGAAGAAGGIGPPATRQELALAVMFACVGVICAVLTEATLWRRPGLEPGPLGLLRGVGSSRFIGGTLGAVTAYLAVVYLLAGVAAPLITTGRWPQRVPSGPVDPGALGGDLVEAGAAGFIEELSLFAIPVALLGLWKSRQAWWAGLLLVIALRFGIHLYYGVGFAAIMVVPWMVAARLLYRAIGSIWPLIIGHGLFDAALGITHRTGQRWPAVALYAAAGIGVLLVVCTIWRKMRSAGARSNRHNDSGPTMAEALSSTHSR